MKEAILAVLMGLPRAPEAGTEHLATIAQAIDSATLKATCQGGWEALGCRRVWPGSRKTLAAGLVTTGYFESGFYARIQRNECRIRMGECDGGRARSYWQFQRTGAAFAWWNVVVGDTYYPTTLAAYTASVALGGHYNRCKSIEGAIAGYASGSRCEWKHAPARARLWARLEAKLDVHAKP